MFNAEVRRMLVEVISSWQVLAVCVVLVIYMFIVNYVARIYHGNSRKSFIPKGKGKKQEVQEPSDSDELDLEEAK